MPIRSNFAIFTTISVIQENVFSLFLVHFAKLFWVHCKKGNEDLRGDSEILHEIVRDTIRQQTGTKLNTEILTGCGRDFN